MRFRFAFCLFATACVLSRCAVNVSAQEAAQSKPKREPVTFTTQEDHRNMLEQLGITKLRPGPSGNDKAANHANYDESLANPFPHLPDVLKLSSGNPVTTPEQWWKQRRPEIVEDFEREVLGRVPANVPKVTWQTIETFESKVGQTPVIEKRLLTFISYGVPEKGDAKWLDQQGSYMAAVAAGPVFKLLGAKDLGTSDDYMKEKMPAVNVGLLDGHLAWRQHDGGHTDAPNVVHFTAWANKHFEAQPAKVDK